MALINADLEFLGALEQLCQDRVRIASIYRAEEDFEAWIRGYISPDLSPLLEMLYTSPHTTERLKELVSEEIGLPRYYHPDTPSTNSHDERNEPWLSYVRIPPQTPPASPSDSTSSSPQANK